MRVDIWLTENTEKLAANGIGTAHLDALILLEDATKKDRGWLLAHPEFELTTPQYKLLQSQVWQRINYTPIAYIRGFSEFYARRFVIDPAVLEPRPESETMIDLATLCLAKCKHPIKVLDMGTGSGALGITTALESHSPIDLTLLDIDNAALEIAKVNAKRYGVVATFIQSSLWSALDPIEFDVVLANLPYVPQSYHVNEAAMLEPKHAIFGGLDGLDIYRTFFSQTASFDTRPSYILTESLPPQHISLKKIAAKAGYKNSKTSDFIQVFQRREKIE